MKLPAGVTDRRAAFARRFHALAATAAPALDLPEAESSLNAEWPKLTDVLHLPVGYADTIDPAWHPMPEPVPADPLPTLVIPGLLGDSVAALIAPLMCARQRLALLGYEIDVAWVNGRASCERNAPCLYRQLCESTSHHGRPVVLVGYSKGLCDALHMLVRYPDSHAHVHALVSLAGVVRGTPLAAQVPPWFPPLFRWLPVPGVGFGDGKAIASLTPSYRQRWLAENPLPWSIRYASIVAVPTAARVSRLLRHSYRKLARTTARNDSQVIDEDAILPAGELLAVVNADHWAVALPIEKRLGCLSRWLIDQNRFPRLLLLRALIDHLNTPQSRSAG